MQGQVINKLLHNSSYQYPETISFIFLSGYEDIIDSLSDERFYDTRMVEEKF